MTRSVPQLLSRTRKGVGRVVATAADVCHVATECRVAERYLDIAERLSHPAAPVRMAALHVLDRLGRNHPEHRQAIADIWCAYLRQHFTPPARYLSTVGPQDLWSVDPAESECQVRTTAQRLLAARLRLPGGRTDPLNLPPGATDQYWRLDRLDLTGATLVEADFNRCLLPVSAFDNAVFYGWSNFYACGWSGRASFDGARFRDRVDFVTATFHADSSFVDTRFAADADFRDGRFDGAASWADAVLHGYAVFDSARFVRPVVFDRARFLGRASFLRTRFENEVEFSGTVFEGAADFTDLPAPVGTELNLVGATADLLGTGPNAHHWPPGWTLIPADDLPPGRGRVVPDTAADPRTPPMPRT